MKLFELASLKGRRVLLTGAAGGLGKVFADTLAELGAELILVDRKGSALPQLADELTRRHGSQPLLRFCDLESQEERQALIDEMHAHGSLSVLINNAAFVGTSELQGWGVPFEQQTVDTWRRALEVNLTAAFHLCQGLAPVLKQSPGASIINLGSIYGVHGPDWSVYAGTSMSNPAAYGASKGGLIQFTRWLATTLAPHVRVNAISPGGITRGQSASFVVQYEARTPLGRMATEDDFIGVVAFLATDMSAYMTGQNLMVDGGWGVW